MHVVAIDGAAEADFSPFPSTKVGMGQVGRMLRAFRSAGATDIVIIGPAMRPDLRRITPDAGFFLSLPAILRILASGGDDGVLRGVVRFFEQKGFVVLGPADVAPETLAPPAALGQAHPAQADDRDIALGFEVIRVLGDLDVGQAVVVDGGEVEAIEGAEGTDRMLERVAARRAGERQPASRSGVLVKRPKPGQELRVDMPSVGPGTVTRAAEAGLRGIAVHAGDVLVADRQEVVRRADALGLFVTGAADRGQGAAGAAASPWQVSEQIGRLAPSAHDRRDIELAVRVTQALDDYRCGSAAVVSRGYVLAVEAGQEGARQTFGRVESLRAGRASNRRRKGVAVIADSEIRPLTEDIVASIARAGLAGMAIRAAADWERPHRDVISACDDEKVFLVRVDNRPGALR